MNVLGATEARGVESRLRDAGDLFGLLAAMIALALLLNQLWWGGFQAGHPLVIGAALVVLLRPRSVGRLLTLFALEVAAVASDMPDVGDHTLLIAVCGAAVLAQVAATSATTGRLPEPGELFVRIAPFLRASVVVLYAAVALSKLNSDFLDPAVSCAAAMSAKIVWFDPGLLGSWRVEPAIWGTIAVEASLPLLLALRRTRAAGLLLGVIFHLVLALAGNVPFSALMLALYVAFLPADAPSRVRAALAGTPAERAFQRISAGLAGRREGLAFAVLIVFWFGGTRLEDQAPALVHGLLGEGTRLVIALLVIAALWLALRIRKAKSENLRPAAGGLRPLHPALIAGLGLLVLNSLSPYIGLKTASSFNMFSNLHTEAGRWNHALIPEAVRIFPLQDDLARVIRTDDPILQRTIDDDELIPTAELERYLDQHPSAAADAVVSDGTPFVAASPAPVQLGGISLDVLLGRLGKFNPVPASDATGGC